MSIIVHCGFHVFIRLSHCVVIIDYYEEKKSLLIREKQSGSQCSRSENRKTLKNSTGNSLSLFSQQIIKYLEERTKCDRFVD